MSAPFVGEVRLFAYWFEPNGWAACDGRLLSIQDNQALFAVVANTYGGDGRNTFALPNIPPLEGAEGTTFTYFIAMEGGFPSR